MSTNKRSNTPVDDPDPELVTTRHGRISPITGERPVSYTLGTRSDSPMFTSIDDLRKAKRERRLDPHSSSPLPNIFETPRGQTPTMDEIMPKLQEMKEGWGEKRSIFKKGGRIMMMKPPVFLRNTQTNYKRKTKKSRKSKKSKKSKKSRKKRAFKKTKK